MNIDEQIKKVLSEEINELKFKNEQIDANPFKQMKAGFAGQMSWMYGLVMFVTFLFVIGMVYCGYQFYVAQDVKSLMGWSMGVIVFALFTQVSKMWYWTELGHNRVIREVKLLELQVAHLTEKVRQQDSH